MEVRPPPDTKTKHPGYYTLEELSDVATMAESKMPGKVVLWRIVVKDRATFLEVITKYILHDAGAPPGMASDPEKWNARMWVELGAAPTAIPGRKRDATNYREATTGQWGF